MNNRPPKNFHEQQIKSALDEIGGEPLTGSGFEEETPEEGFTQESGS